MTRSNLLIMLALTLTVAVGCGAVKQSYLDSFVGKEKQNMPKMLFSNVNAIDVASGDGELIYLCQLKGMDDDQAKQGRRKTQQALNDYVTRNSEKLKDLIANKIKLTIAIIGKDKSELYRVTVNPWELE